MEFVPSIFGCRSSEIQKTCLITPVLTPGLLKGLEIKSLSRGRPYSTGQGPELTLLLSPIGAGYVGDAALRLRDSPCERLILLGSCGAVKDMVGAIGDLVTPITAYPFEGFTELLTSAKLPNPEPQSPSPDFLKNLLSLGQPYLKPVRCATFSSLILENQHCSQLIARGIDIVDMECSAFFAAAGEIQRLAVGLFYISDILGHNSPSQAWDEHHGQLFTAQNQALALARRLSCHEFN